MDKMQKTAIKKMYRLTALIYNIVYISITISNVSVSAAMLPAVSPPAGRTSAHMYLNTATCCRHIWFHCLCQSRRLNPSPGLNISVYELNKVNVQRLITCEGARHEITACGLCENMNKHTLTVSYVLWDKIKSHTSSRPAAARHTLRVTQKRSVWERAALIQVQI